MTHSDTQNDTGDQALRRVDRRIREVLKSYGYAPNNDLIAQLIAANEPILAQREQAAELRGFMLGQGYKFVATPGVNYANGYYEKVEDDGTTTVCNEYIAQQKYEQATKPEKGTS